MTDNLVFPSLDRNRSEIRLLKVLPPSTNGTASFQFRIVSLDDYPTFACVSYVWGVPSETDVVLNGYAARISIGQVLPAIKTAIYHYQEIRGCDAESLWLWADALCINQSDEGEKSSQVPLMARIFSRAEHVICCPSFPMPGLFGRQFQAASKSLNELERRLRMAGLVGKDNNLIAPPPLDCRIINWVEGFDDLHLKLKCIGWLFITAIEYWRRVWILQEVILASNAIIAHAQERFDWWKLKLVSRWRTAAVRLPKPSFVGKESWESLTSNNVAVFWDLVEIFAGPRPTEAEETRRGKAGSDTHSTSRHDRSSSEKMLSTPQYTYPQNIQSRLRPSTLADMISNAQQGRSPTLKNWLTSFQSGSSLRATNPKDHIYGLLAIAPIAIIVDYSQSVKDVYSNYVAAYLRDWNDHFREKLPQLYFLRYCGRGKDWVGTYFGRSTEDDVPSWAPNYPFFSRNYVSDFRFDANLAPFGYHSSSDKGIFPPRTKVARVLFDAGISRLLVSGIILEAFSSTSLLRCRGDKMLDIVSGIKQFNKDAPAVSVLVQTVMWEKLQQESNTGARDMLMAQLVDSCASMLREEIAERYPEAATARKILRVLDLDACKSDNEPPGRSFRRELMLNRDTQYGQRLFFSEYGHLCLTSPSLVRQGDLLCILDGGSMLSILRPQGSYYIHICQAFVLGLENGQAIEYLRRGDTKIQQFELI